MKSSLFFCKAQGYMYFKCQTIKTQNDHRMCKEYTMYLELAYCVKKNYDPGESRWKLI